jgi:hypothetical protein
MEFRYLAEIPLADPSTDLVARYLLVGQTFDDRGCHGLFQDRPDLPMEVFGLADVFLYRLPGFLRRLEGSRTVW